MKFFIGVAIYYLDLKNCFSLKDKRKVVKSLIDKIGKNNHMSIAEVGNNDYWKSAMVGVTCVSSSEKGADDLITRASRIIESAGIEIISEERNVVSPWDLEG
ncbi:MAG: DUF503 domain-containing protein [Actinomycetota bacterium]|nr:DUF503 domain-containing protein [Actinomycetota bacterium]